MKKKKPKTNKKNRLAILKFRLLYMREERRLVVKTAGERDVIFALLQRFRPFPAQHSDGGQSRQLLWSQAVLQGLHQVAKLTAHHRHLALELVLVEAAVETC